MERSLFRELSSLGKRYKHEARKLTRLSNGKSSEINIPYSITSGERILPDYSYLTIYTYNSLNLSILILLANLALY
jgi:hypothetical protein